MTSTVPIIDNSLMKKAIRDYLPERLDQVAEVWQVICRYGKDRAILRKMVQGVHDLVTTTQCFGFMTASACLIELENGLIRLQEAPEESDYLLSSEVGAAIEAVKRSLQETVLPRVPARRRGGDALLSTAEWEGKRHICCLGLDAALLPELQGALEENGYGVDVFKQTKELIEALAPLTPAALVLDSQWVRDLADILDTLHAIKELRKFKVALIFLSSSGDLADRLQAMRSGGEAFFSAPWDSAAIVAKVNELVLPHGQDPYRVLVVDDDPTQAQFAAGVLRKAGMQTKAVTEALEVMDALADFIPDLILMDLYMPDADGMELTTIIREHSQSAQIPIVFLSGEKNAGVQMDALASGGEAFLAKPIGPRRLISSVQEVIRRVRGRRIHLPE